MKVEQLLEQMDKNIKVLRESVEDALTMPKVLIKEKYGSIKTYNECVHYERGALDGMINFRQWIVNRIAVEKSNELIKDNMWYIDKHNLV